MIQVGIIGSGFIGPAHIEALRRLGNVQVVALCDSSLAVAQARASVLQVPHAYGSVEALLAHPGGPQLYAESSACRHQPADTACWTARIF